MGTHRILIHFPTVPHAERSPAQTTLALHMIAEAQKLGGKAVFIDAEHALDMKYASNLGVDIDDLLMSQPDSGEAALEIADTLIRSQGVDIIVIDSVAALVPKAELEGDMGDPHMALQARLMSQALRKLSHSLARSQAVMVFLNQVRAKLSMGGWGGIQETTAGGKALKYYSSMRLDVRRIGGVKTGAEAIGDNVRIKVRKNKLAPPHREVVVELVYGKGICKYGEMLDLGVANGVLRKSGAFYYRAGDQENHIGHGREKTKAYLESNPEVAEEIRSEIRASLERQAM